MQIRRTRGLWIVAAAAVCISAVGIGIAQRSDDATSSGEPLRAVRSPRFNVLPASLASRSQVPVVQVDADRAVVFGGVTWDKKSISVANDGVMIDFASGTSTALAGPKLDDGLVRVRAAVYGDKVLLFGMECASGPLPPSFDGEGDVADPCVDGPLTLTTLDVTMGAWSDPATAPASVGGNVRWIADASVVGHTVVIGWFESGRDTETFTAYDIPSGTWRALDSPSDQLREWCSTRTDVVGVTYNDSGEGGGGVPPSRARLWLLDPNTGTWTSVVVPEVFGPGVGGVVCTTNRPVLYGYPAPNLAATLFAYSPGDATWQPLPAAPEHLPGRFVGAGNVGAGWSAPDNDAPHRTSLLTIDIAQSEPRWSSHLAATASESTEIATGVHGGGVVIAREDDRLYRVRVDE